MLNSVNFHEYYSDFIITNKFKDGQDFWDLMMLYKS